MKSTKKGNIYYFGAKMHAGVDADTGMIHTVETTAANVHDNQPALDLLRDDDKVMYGDSAYSGVRKQERAKQDPLFPKSNTEPTARNPIAETSGRKVPAHIGIVRWRRRNPESGTR